MTMREELKRRRSELGLTLEDVAKVVGVTRQTVQKYESGVVTNIPSDRIELLARVLRTTPAFLMGWEGRSGSCELPEVQRRISEIISQLSPESQRKLLELAELYRDAEQKK